MPQMACFGLSDCGRKRLNNEDAFLAREDLGVVALADGMGGAAAGEVASHLFIEAALDEFSKARADKKDLPSAVGRSFERGNSMILAHVKDNPSHRGMGCTAEILGFSGGRYFLGHVGDSRTYLYRNGRLVQLTRDHSFVQQKVDQGFLTESEARRHPLRSIILRAVGVSQDLNVDRSEGEIFPGDLFLLCSDGLTDMIEDRSISAVLDLPLNLVRKSQKLIDLANSAGGNDNITVVLSEALACGRRGVKSGRAH